MSSIIPEVSKLSSRVIRVLGCNPGLMTLQGTNTYVVGTGKSRLMIDCGEPNVSKYISNLKDVIKDNDIKVSQIVITHWHNDHIGGTKDVLRSLQMTDREHDKDFLSLPLTYLSDGQKLSSEGATLRVVATPGHTKDHLVLLLEEENALFSGDCILGEGSAVFEDLFTYMKSLNAILGLKPSVIYPGHGRVINEPTAKIQEYIAHRNRREEEIIEVMTHLNKPLTPMEIVENVYKDVNPQLYGAAVLNVTHHLEKLIKEKKICELQENHIKRYKII